MPADPATGPDQALKLAEALLEGTQDAMILVRRDGTMQAVRGGSPLAQGLGLSLEEVVKDPESYLSDADMKHIEEVWHAVKAAPGALHHASFTIHDAQGHAVSVQASASNLVHTPLAAIVVRLSHERESQLPPPPTSDNVWPDDPLWQRSQFLELLQKAVKRKADRVWNAPKHVRAAMRDRRCDYAVVLLNLDRHGVLRGNFGEQELSGLMKSAAERLWKALRARDAVACLGGSELALYLDAVGDAEHAERVVDGYVRMLEDRFELDGESISLSPIVGIATSERRYERAEEVLRDAAAAASRAMRRARSGRQAYDTGIRVEDRRRLILAADLREGLKRGELFEHFQPIVRLKDRALVGFEALARWRHPTLELVGPAEFIPVAEETGLIRKLGMRVLRRACGQLAMWNTWAPQPVTVSVNVSAAELVHEAFARDVETTLTDSGLSAEHLVLEVTEGALLEDLAAAKAAMLTLRQRGVSFALDDFGTGYASLSYLVDLPFNRLKIDRSLVHETDPHRKKVLKAMVALGHELGLVVIAEGVETASQERQLRDIGCDYGQGWLFGAGQAAADAEALLRQSHGAPS